VTPAPRGPCDNNGDGVYRGRTPSFSGIEGELWNCPWTFWAYRALSSANGR
jgi:hypothetical protein